MTNIKRIALVLSLFIFTSHALVTRAQEAQTPSEPSTRVEPPKSSAWSNLDVSLSAGYRHSQWTAGGFRWDLLLLSTEELRSYEGTCMLFWNRWPMAFYKTEGPVDSSPTQNELFKIGKQDKSAMKKIEAGLIFCWIPGIQESDKIWARVIRKTRYTHTEETYFGNAIAMSSFDYVPMTAQETQDPDGSVYVDEITPVLRNDDISFKTKFKNDELTFPVAFAKDKAGCDSTLWAGLYHTTWERPSDLNRLWYAESTGHPVVFGTKFSSTGLVLGSEVSRKFWREDMLSFNTMGLFRFGIDNDMENVLGDTMPGEDWVYLGLLADLWLELNLSKPSGMELRAKAGILADLRNFGDDPGSLLAFEDESDSLMREYITFSLWF